MTEDDKHQSQQPQTPADHAQPGSEDELVLASQQVIQELLVILGEAWEENTKLHHQLEHLQLQQAPTDGSTQAVAKPPGVIRKDKLSGVLIIEDSRVMQNRFKSILEPLGYKIVGMTNDGETGVKWALTRQPKLVILDFVLPTISGLECLRRIRALHSQAKIIICSGQLTVKASREFIKLGIDEIITKPIQLNTFLRAVKRCMGKTPEEDSEE